MFTVDNVTFNRATDGSTAVGVCNALNEATREATVVFNQNGLNWTLPYRECFAATSNANGERPEFMPLDADGNPIAFSDGERMWDPATDLGMTT